MFLLLADQILNRSYVHRQHFRLRSLASLHLTGDWLAWALFSPSWVILRLTQSAVCKCHTTCQHESSCKTIRSGALAGRTEPHACIEKENHATLFSWSAWLVACIAGACALRRETTTTMSRNMAAAAIFQLIGCADHAGHAGHAALVYRYTFDTGHPCYGQLQYRGLLFGACRGHMLFEVGRWRSTGFLNGSQAQARLIYFVIPLNPNSFSDWRRTCHVSWVKTH